MASTVKMMRHTKQGTVLSMPAAVLLKTFIFVYVFSTKCEFTNGEKKGLFYDFIGNDVTVLRLSCHVGFWSPDNKVASVTIFNVTSGEDMADFFKGEQPQTIENGGSKDLFVAGRLRGDNNSPGFLDLISFNYDSSRSQLFGCKVSRRTSLGFDTFTMTVSVNKTENPTPKPPSIPVYRSQRDDVKTGGLKATEPAGVKVSKPTSRSSGSLLDSLPMPVLIAMLVLISTLVILAIALILQRCYLVSKSPKAEPIYRPATYYMPYEPRLEFEWKDSSPPSRQILETNQDMRSVRGLAPHPLQEHNTNQHKPLPPIPVSD